MPPGLTLNLDLKGAPEIEQCFKKTGDSVRIAVAGVFRGFGAEIVRQAKSNVPAKRAAKSIGYRVSDGVRNKGSGSIKLVVDTFDRRFRWVQQFEEGTVGTFDQDATHGEVTMGVRSHTRGLASRNVYQVIGRSRRKLVASGFVRVRSYSHRFHMPMKPWMKPAFDAVKDTIAPAVEKAIAAELAADKGAA